MITSSAYNNLVTVQTRDLDGTQDAMDLNGTWTDLFTDFAQVSMVLRVQQLPQHYQQEWVEQGVFRFTFRGDYSFSAGDYRFFWEGNYYTPVGLSRRPGIFRFENLSYVYARLAGPSLTR